VDQTAPVIKSLSITQIPGKENVWTFITGDDDQKLLYQYFIDHKAKPEPGQSYSISHSASIKAPELTDGMWYIHVKAIDRAGNESAFFTFNSIIDDTPPVIQIKNISDNHLMQKWIWFADKKETGISYRHLLDQLPNSSPTGDFNAITQTRLSNVNGQWFLHVQAKDGFGNLSQVVTTSVFMDCTPPEIKGLSNDLIPKKEKTWEWHSNETETTFRYEINQLPKKVLKGQFKTVNQAKISGVNGTYYLHVQAKDAAGNISDVISVSALLDNTIAKLKGLADDPIPRKTKIWTWKSSENEASYRFLINNKPIAQLTGPFTSQNSATIANKDGKYFLHVQTQDAAKNLSKIKTVYCILDNTKPVITKLFDSPKPTKSKTWKWSATDTDSVIRFRYAIDQNKTAPLSNKFTKTKTAHIKDKNGRWYLHVQARDRAGNMSDIKTVFAILDNTPPVLTLKTPDKFRRRVWRWSAKDADKQIVYSYRCDRNKTFSPKYYYTSQMFFDPIDCIFNASKDARQLTDLNGRWFFHVSARDRNYNTVKKTESFTFDFSHKGLYANLYILFEPDSVMIKHHSIGKLQKLSEIMKKYPDAVAIIEAHTDNLGDETYNLKLSEKRAESIKAYLNKKLSISDARLKCRGYGETKPLFDNNTKKGRNLNRRAEVLLKSNNID
jgi:outer membrane protein OmpA-like peptidoglycan-associated protein